MSAQPQVAQTVLSMLQQVIGTATPLNLESSLLGAVAEFDSSAILAILTMLEDFYGIMFDDEELEAKHFASVQTLVAFVHHKLN